MDDDCEHKHGIDYRQTNYALSAVLATVHRFTCTQCRVEARLTDQVEKPKDGPVNPG